MLDRERQGRAASPSAGVLDSQTVKAPAVAGGGGYAGQQGFTPLPSRRVIERTFVWMMLWRRLMRDYERLYNVSEAMIHLSIGALLLRRIAHPSL